MVRVKEVYKRGLTVGDYFLYCYYPYEFDTVVVGKMVATELGLIHMDNDNVLLDIEKEIYKLPGRLPVYEQYWLEGREEDELIKEKYKGVYYKLNDYMIDIFGRTLNIGDFVMFKKKNTHFTKRGIEYGIVIDKNTILAYPEKIVKVKIVYKVEHMSEEELELYKSISSKYRDRQTNVIQNIGKKELELGGIYIKKNMVYVYLGKWIYRNCGILENKLSKELLERSSKEVDMYIRFDITKKKSWNLYNNILHGDMTGIKEYTKSRVVTYQPPCFTHDISKLMRGKNTGKIDNINLLLNTLEKEYFYNNQYGVIYYRQI